MKKILCFILIIASPFLLANEYQKFDRTKHNFEDGGRWTGSLSLDETVIHANGVVNGKSEKHVRVAFLDALPASNGNYDSADNKGTGTYSIQGESTMIGGQKCSMDCQGGGLAILNAVNINEEANTYDIDAIGPDCNGTKTCTGEGTKPYGPDGDDEITVSDQHLLDKDVLSGTVSTSAELPNGLGTITKTITWHLVRSKATDVELIVTPADYDTWLPEPGKNELNKGSVMTINLKLQGKNGKPFQEKAESFELRLSNTSKDTGITINYPISPDAKQLPDLRFLMHPGIESIEEDQFISVGSSDGLTGKALIASYDGGGWTTLTVEAILKDKRHIRGSLLVSNGETDIRIPKRDPNSKIAKAWLKANGNPGDMDDREATTGNINDGDGLTAYEEYRGVIAITKVQGSFKEKFRRLDPKKKELGVLVKRKQFPLFSEGIDWLENATGLEVIRFDETEIDADRRLNKNGSDGSYAHSYNQYVEKLDTGTLSGDAVGENEPATNGFAKIPAKSTGVVIDIKKLNQGYRNQVADLAAANRLLGTNIRMPYTLAEDIANTVAHELAHGVNVNHHGKPSDKPDQTIPPNGVDIYHVYDDLGYEITTRPYPEHGKIGVIGTAGNDESGDLSCIMAYTSLYQWAYRYDNNNGSFNYYAVPLLPVGKKLCKSKQDKDPKSINYNNKYFGDAANGNCVSQIKLK